MSENPEAAYHELCAYTLARGDPAFIHQLVVDAWGAQSAGPHDRPIRLTMSLVGLYLHVEHGWSGRRVQWAHMRLGRHKQTWPAWRLPDDRGAVTSTQVLATPAGPDRDRAIDAWCASVWTAYSANRQTVADLLRQHGITP